MCVERVAGEAVHFSTTLAKAYLAMGFPNFKNVYNFEKEETRL